MTEFVLFCIPTLVYVVVQSRGRDRTLRSALARAGVSWGSASAYGWASLLLVPLTMTAWLAIELVPTEVIEMPGISVAQVTSVVAVLGVALRALGEEIFFRGLLAGILIKRLGFGWGNLLQSLLFLLPHLALLLVDLRIWPVIPVQFAVGWLLGWLRHKTGTFVPCAVIHVIANITGGLIAA